MKKQDIIISDDTLTKEQKEKLEQEFFERQQKELHKGKLFLTASVIALYANAVITAAFYPLYLRNLLRSMRLWGEGVSAEQRRENLAGLGILLVLLLLGVLF